MMQNARYIIEIFKSNSAYLFYPAFCNQSNEKETKINVKIHRQHQLYLLYKVDISESLQNVEVEN